jgi:DNA polymerase
MGALDTGLTEEELPDIVIRWREANNRICDLWYVMESAAVKVITDGGCVGARRVFLSREIENNTGAECLTILLPSGRRLFYINPKINENEHGRPCISYFGKELGHKNWNRIDTYGGKLLGDCVHALVRDRTYIVNTVKQLAIAEGV